MTKADLASIRARSFMRLHHKARAVLGRIPSNDNPACSSPLRAGGSGALGPCDLVAPGPAFLPFHSPEITRD